MSKKRTINPGYVFITLVFLVALYFFYFRYVPLIKPFQMILVPILLLLTVVTALNEKNGILVFIFIFPLLSNLPYFFKIYHSVPHAPVVLVLFLFFVLGWLIRSCLTPQRLKLDHPLFRPFFWFILLVVISGIISCWRYAGFFPLQLNRFYDLIVNVNGVRSGGAIMSCLFSMLNYIIGFLFLVLLYNRVKTREFANKILAVLAVSTLFIYTFSLIQRYFSLEIGNMPYFIFHNRLNATFQDPNSFGFFVSLFLPVLLGMFFVFQKRLKILVLFLFFFSLFIFPYIGSRSGMLTIVVAALVFLILWMGDYKISRKKKLIYIAAFTAVVLVIIAGAGLFSEKTNLYARIKNDLNIFSRNRTVDSVIGGRKQLWSSAVGMAREYPLSGVGTGGYIIEFPNFNRKQGFSSYHTDSAESYFLQVGAELGFLGLLLLGWLIFEIIKVLRRSRNLPADNSNNRFLIYGLIAGVTAGGVNFLFHSYIGAFDAKCFFWLLVGLLMVYTRAESSPAAERKKNSLFGWIALAGLLIFSGIFLWNSTHSLSVFKAAEKYGWKPNFGLYRMEQDERAFRFHWTRKTAGFSFQNLHQTLVLPIRATHPGIERYPVKVGIYLADVKFQPLEILQELTIDHSQWQRFEYDFRDFPLETIYLVFKTERDWQPQKMLGVTDSRKLAIGLGMPWFVTPSESPDYPREVYERIAEDKWERQEEQVFQGDNISHRLKFRVDKENSGLRLLIQGRKAKNVGPFITVRLDSLVIGKLRLETEHKQGLIFIPELSVGEHLISVELENYYIDPAADRDRSILLGDLEIFTLPDH